jgi:hypothetical protein
MIRLRVFLVHITVETKQNEPPMDIPSPLRESDDFRVPSKASLRASGQVQSLARALHLLKAIASHPQGVALSALAKKVGLPTSTAHRLLTTMQNDRFVRFDTKRALWQIGEEANRVGAAFTSPRDSNKELAAMEVHGYAVHEAVAVKAR